MSTTIYRHFSGYTGPVTLAKSKKKDQRDPKKSELLNDQTIPAQLSKKAVEKVVENVSKVVSQKELKKPDPAVNNLTLSMQKKFQQVEPGFYCFKFPFRASNARHGKNFDSLASGIAPEARKNVPVLLADFQETGVTRDGMKVYAFT